MELKFSQDLISNLVINNYIFRHESLNNLYLYDFVSYLKCTKTANEIDFPFMEKHKFHKTRGMMLKKEMDIPSIFGPFFRKPVENPTIEELKNYENSICILFQPFRSFSTPFSEIRLSLR